MENNADKVEQGTINDKGNYDRPRGKINESVGNRSNNNGSIGITKTNYYAPDQHHRQTFIGTVKTKRVRGTNPSSTQGSVARP